MSWAMRPAPNACSGAGTILNAVVRFYLAIAQHRYGTARTCLDPMLQQTTPTTAFTAGYAHTVATRLDLITSEESSANSNTDAVPVTRVALRGVDQLGSRLVQTAYAGTWTVTPDGHLRGADLRVLGGGAVHAVTGTNVAAAVSHARQFVMWSEHVDVNGNGIPDDVYDTSGQGCASCHGQYVYIFERGVLIFAEANSDVNWVRTRHGVMTIKAGRDLDGYHTETWRWTPTGFVLETPCAVVRSSDTASDALALPMGSYLPGSRRSEADALYGSGGLARYGFLSGMNKAFPGYGYAAGCVETVALPGSPSVTAYVQTDVFQGRKGGERAYAWDAGPQMWGNGPSRNVTVNVDFFFNQSGEAVVIVDSDDKDASNRGTWLLAHLRQGEILLTVMLYAKSTDLDALDRVTADFSYLTPALTKHLSTLSEDWFTCAGQC